MTKPYFSIIVPVYNKEKSLDACIASLLSQDFPKDDYEIIAIDNGSSDNSPALISRYASIKLLYEKQPGAYAARNAGILNARGSVIVFTDADVEVRSGWLAKIYNAMEGNGHDLLIGWYAPGRPIRLLQIHSLLVCERIRRALRRHDPSMLTACAANLAIRKAVFVKEGLFQSNSNSEDMYFAIRCLEKNYNVGFDDSIEIKRNDIDSIGIFFLKNFIYGCSNARDIRHRLSCAGKLRYMMITVRYIIKYFPAGLGLLLFASSYFTGYFLSRLKILDEDCVARIVRRYTLFTSRRAL
ncbi:MAG: glycosyltransferase [Candidatus Omnitrophica bacterium]|nr:glycosyltransferase [Candidatus Omnitrophota bacterium]